MKDNAHEDVTDSLSLFRTITLGAILETGAQAVHVHVHGRLRTLSVPAPHLVEQLHAGVGAPRSGEQAEQQLELLGWQFDLLAAALDRVAIRVQNGCTNDQPVRFGCAAAPQKRH